LTGKGLTKAYIDLLFAYALARLGEHDASNELRFRATEVLLEEPEPHKFLLKAFDHRIDEALHGRPTKGALPPQLMDDLDQVPRLERSAVDRMRSFSRILEPDTKLDPYRHWGARISDLDKALADLADVFDRQEVSDRVTELLKEVGKSASDETGEKENRAKI